MKWLFLKRDDSSRLTVFFAGWGMDERPLAHLAGGDADFLLCYDYTTPPDWADADWAEFEKTLASYERVSLAAFSLGVWAAAETFGPLRISFEEAVAINGTLRPIDPDYGIPPERFARTAEKWSEKTRMRFYRRMCGDAKTLEFFLARAPARSVDSQREELLAVGRRIADGVAETTIFHRAFVGSRDRIFPPEAQRRFWETEDVEVIESPTAHYPFADGTIRL